AWTAAGGVATADGEFTRRLLDNVDDEDHLIRLRTRSGRNIDAREEVQLLKAALGPTDQHLIEGIAFAQIKLTTDHIVTGTRVAANLDPLDIGASALIDRVGNRDRL